MVRKLLKYYKQLMGRMLQAVHPFLNAQKVQRRQRTEIHDLVSSTNRNDNSVALVNQLVRENRRLII